MNYRCQLLLIAMLWTTSGALQAAKLTWTVTGATFDDGGTISGVFVTDELQPAVVTAWSVNVAGGEELQYPARAYDQTNSTASSEPTPSETLRTYRFISTDTSPTTPRELRMAPTGPLDGSIASVPLDLANTGGNLECYRCSPFRAIASGSLELTSVSPNLVLESIVPDPSEIDALTTATISLQSLAALGPATGTVSVLDSSDNTVCTITLPALSCEFAPTSSGGQTLTARYNGDSTYDPTDSNELSFLVNGNSEGAAPIPTLSQWMLVLLGFATALIGAARLTRRAHATN